MSSNCSSASRLTYPQRKRAKTTSPSAHKDSSPIELLLDNKNLTDEGLAEAARGLEEALHQSQLAGHGTLSILSLAGNSLTSRSLFWLAQSVRLACDELLELDLSSNNIRVASHEDARHLAVFLDALGQCTVLRTFNLSKNDLCGSRAWEVFAKAYSDQWLENSTALEHLSDDIDDMGNDMLNVVASTKALSVTVQGGQAAAPDSSAEKVQRRRGLPSIGTIMINDASLTDSGALWLSFCNGRHAWGQDRLKARQGNEVIGQGFCLSPNDKLSTVGQKVLKQAAEARHSQAGDLPPVPENSLISQHTSVDAGVSRYACSSSFLYDRKLKLLADACPAPAIITPPNIEKSAPLQAPQITTDLLLPSKAWKARAGNCSERSSKTAGLNTWRSGE